MTKFKKWDKVVILCKKIDPRGDTYIEQIKTAFDKYHMFPLIRDS